LQTYRARRVLRADRRGSSWPVILDTEAGPFYTKLRGAAQGPATLIAEILVGGLADAVGLSVPARVLIDLPPGLHSDDRNDELADLLQASAGLSLGFQVLPGVRDFRLEDVERVAPELASAIVWLDGLVFNPDRTARNPNLLWSHGRLWLIDHGACLGFHHDWASVTESSARAPGCPIDQHVLAARATLMQDLDRALADRLDRPVLEAVVDAVPDEFFTATPGPMPPSRRRAAYVGLLRKRLRPPRPFLSFDSFNAPVASDLQQKHDVTRRPHSEA
jgi:HipA-like kinase